MDEFFYTSSRTFNFLVVVDLAGDMKHWFLGKQQHTWKVTCTADADLSKF